MHTIFKNYIESEQLFSTTDKIILGVSGGMDSIVMMRLFQKCGFYYAVAHCNFSLRDTESDGDYQFVSELATQFKVPFFSIRFDTNSFSKLQKVSTQMAARELRYAWFEELRKKEGYDYIAIASHKDDELETILINLTKGAVLGGFHGILEKNGKIIRPMMCFSRQDIETYVNEYEIPHRHDSSNDSTKYIRNKLRHLVVPVLKEINPNLLSTLGKNIKRTRQVEQVYLEAIKEKTEGLLNQSDDRWSIEKNKLKELSPIEPYLYEVLKPFGFKNSVIEKITKTSADAVGKIFTSTHYSLLIDREKIFIYPKEEIDDSALSIIEASNTKTLPPVELLIERFKKGDRVIEWQKHIAYFDEDKLTYPLSIRKWKHGDRFKPLGMNGFKKISDYLIDEKIPHLEKEKVYVLESIGAIVWVIGFRIDDRFKLTPSTTRIIKIYPF